VVLAAHPRVAAQGRIGPQGRLIRGRGCRRNQGGAPLSAMTGAIRPHRYADMPRIADLGLALTRFFTPASAATRRDERAQALLLALLDRSVRDVRLGLEIDGRRFTIGAGSGEPLATLRLRDAGVCTRVLAAGNLGLGEAYMDGAVQMVHGELHEFLAALLRGRIEQALAADPRLAARAAWLRLQTRSRSKADNVRRHYDVGDELFECFLDSAMTYSCGYMREPGDSLEQLQINKFERICDKLELRPGDRLLDIGCGFGGLLIHAARHHGVRGVGITNSRRHCARGQENVARAGLAAAVEIREGDYSRLSERFDRVVSVGMMEHVPRREFGRYFAAIARVLAPGGRGLVHTIGCNGPRNLHDPFIQKYIFPGSCQPRLSEISAGLEREKLAVVDEENIVRHYGHTILRWLERFRERRHTLDPRRHDERVCRMFEYYFHCGIAASFASDSAVYQVIFTRDPAAALRLHRV